MCFFNRLVDFYRGRSSGSVRVCDGADILFACVWRRDGVVIWGKNLAVNVIEQNERRGR